ncbi:MAG TPA: IS3 family transposase [Pyrinomonadaceae bacterium]|nr:IS3 family transposase [Pyrinomonadaceae bacterium]
MELLRQHLEERPTAEWSPTQLGEAVGLSRAPIWRQLRQPSTRHEDELELRSQIQTIALEMRTYGYRPLTAELHQRGVKVNRKRVLRLLREDNLLCLRQRAFVRTTDSRHNLRVYPNLTRDLVLSNINQLWLADITYIRLLREFIYLAVLLDAFSRRCIGWALSRHIDTQLTLAALQMALNTRTIHAGLIHHSDQGVQYAAADCIAVLQEHKIELSMSRTGNPYDNAKAERFMRTLKYEEIYMNDYETLAEVRASIELFIEAVYNRKRLHSAIGYRPPAEFEASLAQLKLS